MVLHPWQVPDGATVASGHRLAAHTADVIIEAWAPTREACVEEAVLGLVASFVDLGGVGDPDGTYETDLSAEDDAELLIAALDEVIYLVDAKGAIVVVASMDSRTRKSVRARYDTVPLDRVSVTGPAPKAVTRHALRFAPDGDAWRCSVVIDV